VSYSDSMHSRNERPDHLRCSPLEPGWPFQRQRVRCARPSRLLAQSKGMDVRKRSAHLQFAADSIQ